MKALEIHWAKPMYTVYAICLSIAGFSSIGYLHGEAGLRELSFEFKFVCSLRLWYFMIILAYYF